MKDDTYAALSSLASGTATSKPANTIYKGERLRHDAIKVTVDGRLLSPSASQRRWNHSPDGFEWGYGGSGPAQLALALLLDYYGFGASARIDAVQYHQDFKWAVVQHFQHEGWTLTGAEIETAMEKIINCSRQENT